MEGGRSFGVFSEESALGRRPCHESERRAGACVRTVRAAFHLAVKYKPSTISAALRLPHRLYKLRDEVRRFDNFMNLPIGFRQFSQSGRIRAGDHKWSTLQRRELTEVPKQVPIARVCGAIS